MKRRITYLSFIAILSFCFLLSGCNSAISISALHIGGSEISKDAFLAEIAEREAYNDSQFISEQWYRVKMQTLSDKKSSDNKIPTTATFPFPATLCSLLCNSVQNSVFG